MSEVKLRGFKELDDELKRLPLKIQQKIVRKMVREGAKIVQKAAIQKAPRRPSNVRTYGKQAHDPGLLKSKKGIVIRRLNKSQTKKKGLGDAIVDSIGLSKAAWYGKFSEFGGKTRQYPKKPFLRPAFDENKGKILATMKAVFLKGLGQYKRG